MFSPIGLYAIVARLQGSYCLPYIDIQSHYKMAVNGCTVPYMAIVVYSAYMAIVAACIVPVYNDGRCSLSRPYTVRVYARV